MPVIGSFNGEVVNYAGHENLIILGCAELRRLKGVANVVVCAAVSDNPTLLIKAIADIIIGDSYTEVRNIILTGGVGIKAEIHGELPRTAFEVILGLEVRSAPVPTGKIGKLNRGFNISFGAHLILNLTDCVDLRDNSIDRIICCERRYCHA